MASILDQYWDELSGRFSRRPVWLPGTPMGLGDIGVLRKSGWEKVADLESIGIKFSREPVGTETAYSYSSAGGAEITVRAGIDADGPAIGVVKGNASLGIKFHRPAAFVLMAEDVEVERIRNLQDVDRAVLDAYHGNSWKKNWIYISEIATGEPALTVISATADGEAIVDLGGTLQAGATELGRVHARVGFGYKKDLAASFVTPHRSAVMWRGHYIRDLLVGKAVIKVRGEQDLESGPVDVPIGQTALAEEVEYLSDVLPGEE